MNISIKTILYLFGLSLLLITYGCEDQIPEEITEIEVNRLFSPTDLEVRIIAKTSVRLNWQPVRNASSYTIEFFDNVDFTGTPIKTYDSITNENLPITIRGFAGASNFSVRVKAIGDDIAESKWISTTFATEPEQIMQRVDPNKIEPTHATLNWPAGELATHIVLEPGNIVHTLTPAEIEAGEAVVTGLASETNYTARIRNGNIIRGTTSFTTLFNPANGIVLTPADDIKARIEAANPGDIFVLMPGIYPMPLNGEINITNTIRIVGARPTNKPVLTGTILRMRNGAGLWVRDVDFNGAIDATTRALYPVRYMEVLAAGRTYGPLLIENSIVRNYFRSLMNALFAVLIESVTIRNNIVDNIECNGGDFIDFRAGMTRVFNFYNNTVSNSAWDRDVLRMDNATAFSATNTSIVTIRNNTFYRVVNLVPTTIRRILFVRLPSHEITVENNIFVETHANYSNVIVAPFTNVVLMRNNNYFLAPNLTNTTFAVHDRWAHRLLNPGFVNPGAGDFTVTNADLIFNRVGDPRWLPAN